MSLEVLAALIVFAAVMSFTPGPNNMMLLASGVNFGVVRSMPHMAGISLGVISLLLAVGFGLHEVFQRAPALFLAIKYAGAAYLLWLAIGIARSGPAQSANADEGGQPMGLFGAAAFQWVNPKAWVMSVGAMATYTSTESHALSVVIVAAVFGLVCLPATGIWTVFGAALRGWLAGPRINRAFNIVMALALVASLWPIVAEWL